MIPRATVCTAALLTVCSGTFAQIRIASYNTATAFETNGTPLPGLQNVLAGIGTASLGGVAKRIDILSLQEQNNSTGTSTQQILNMMNTLYGAGTYAKSNLIADASISPFIDSPAVIYDQTKFTLVSEVKFGTVSGSGMPRQEIRYQFRPVGYGANADFYVYGVHYKALGSASDQNRRNIEAGVMRTNANALPVGSRILYTGDFNLTQATSEAAWATITGAGTNSGTAGIDPAGGSWANTNQTWSTTNLGSRLDFQFQTAPTNDGRGFSLINGTYGPFTNNGAIATGGQSPNANVRSASDHYPVVAGYRYPARLGVSVGNVPSTVIVGANVPVNLTVTNTAPTQAASGADGLDYSVSGSGSLTGTGAGTMLAALSVGNNHALLVNTSTVGTKSGNVNVTSSNQEVANGTFSQAVSVQVIDHAQPSLSNVAGVSVATIDFAIHGRGLGTATSAFSIYNLVGNGTTAGLDLDSIIGAGNTAALTTNAGTFSNLASGANSQNSFVASINSSSNGTFSATYTFNLSDQDLPGATARGPLSLVLKGIIATPGDSDLNGIIDFDDYSHIDNGFNNNSTGWFNGDFDGNGVIDFDDYSLIDLNFNNQSGLGALARAMSYLDGSDRSDVGMSDPGLKLVMEHFNQFGAAYAGSFLNAVPEPGTVLPLIAIGLACSRRRRIRIHS
ncbi:MAG: PEP-CTERM sorting domain-containing protein [Anaerolineae bacterium]|nr:PEP-CTERM sorting domain-containing protein [Phycisphaerae bacterium]